MVRNRIWIWTIVAFVFAQFAASPAHAQSQNGAHAVGIEVSSNGCIVYFASNAPGIKQFDICTNRELPDFNATPLPDARPVQELRSLAGGGMLAADNSAIVRLDASGNIVRTYTVKGETCWSGITLTPDERSFWAAACDGVFVQFDRNSGESIKAYSLNAGTASTAAAAGRMFGGGTLFGTGNEQVNYGIDLHCAASASPDHLQVVWDGYVFLMAKLTSVSCFNDPSINSNAPFNTIRGTAAGTINGLPGATIEFTFTDAGQPGVLNDAADIVVRGGYGFTALEASGKIYAGTNIAGGN